MPPRISPVLTEWCVGIDQSLLAFAAVAYSTNAEPVTGLLKPKTKGPRRLAEIQRWLIDWMNGFDPVVHICMEGYAYTRQMGHSLGELGGVVKTGLLELYGDVELAYPTIVTPQQLKKFTSGNGNEKKNLIVRAVWRKWGYDAVDDNTADAYGLSRIAAAIVTGHTDHQYEADVVSRLKRHTEWDPLKRPSPSSKTGRTSSSG